MQFLPDKKEDVFNKEHIVFNINILKKIRLH